MTRTIKRTFCLAAILGLFIMTATASACGTYGDGDLEYDAIGDDPAIARASLDALRGAGPAGLALLLEAHSDVIDAAAAAGWRSDDAATQELWDRLRLAIDAVGGAKDNHVARLFWHTDFDQARRAAKESNKPILSLRLLGRLDEDLSCANSRFFRTILYANGKVSSVLNDHFVLHWQSVRPVPQITIDFGDGRVIKRTITGNSIHYVLDSEGRPIDALPGLYGPSAFLRSLQESLRLSQNLARAPDDETRTVMLARHHANREAVIKGRWLSHLQSIGAITQDEAVAAVNLAAFSEPGVSFASQIDPQAIPAMIAMPVAFTKAGVEQPTLVAMGLDAHKLEESTSDEVWRRIAQLYEPQSTLDQTSIALMKRKTPDALLASQVSYVKTLEEDPMLQVILKFQQSIALDTVRNEFMLHRRIHEWFAAGEVDGVSADGLNSRVYAELFLTPESDPWLGLVPASSYAALDGGGLSCE